jgi:hypothetical protein
MTRCDWVGYRVDRPDSLQKQFVRHCELTPPDSADFSHWDLVCSAEFSAELRALKAA